MFGKFFLHSLRGQIGFGRSYYSKYSSLWCIFRSWSQYKNNNRRFWYFINKKEARGYIQEHLRDGGENHVDDYPDIEAKVISIHCLRINASEYFLSLLCMIVNVFQAAQMYRYRALKYICKSLFVSVTCWRTCQNMQRSISHSHRNLETHTADQTHTPPVPSGTIFYTTGRSTYPYRCSIASKPLSCTLPGVHVHVCVKLTCHFRLRWSVRSDTAPAPRGYPGVPLSQCGKAEC